MTLAQDRPTASTHPSLARAATRPTRPTRPTLPAGPPPRPQLTSDVVPPWLQDDDDARPRAVWTAALVWFAAVLAGLVAIAAMAADGTALRERLTAAAAQGDPSASQALIGSGVRTTLLLVVGAQSLLALLLLVWLALLVRRHAWARWALLGTALLTVAVAALAQGLVAGGRDLDRLAFAVEGGLLVLAGALTLSRRIGAWLHPGS